MGEKKKMVASLVLFWGLSFIFGSCSKKQNQTINQTDVSFSKQQTLLIEAVKKTGASSADGAAISFVCQLAAKHLDHMISQGKISHDGFDERNRSLIKVGSSKAGEIVAYNCGQDSVEDAAKTCATSWRNSGGHWALMEPFWDANCYDMKASGNCYYCIGLFSNGKLSP